MPDSPASVPSSTTPQTRRPFVLITGMSGAGRATALHALEDLGYVAVDNVPLPLLGDLMHSTSGGLGEMAAPLAFGVDTRTYGFDPHDLVRRLRELRLRMDLAPRLLFLDADTETLRRRYTETRRPHPLAPDRPVSDGIADERQTIGWLRDSADISIDTSALTPHQFKQLLAGHFAIGRHAGMRISVMSFSFRRGLPREADMVFDARFLRNPHYVTELKALTGLDREVGAYVEADPDYLAFVTQTLALLTLLLPRFRQEGKKYATIAVGCTGGRHRSVHIVEQLAKSLADTGWRVATTHRELAREGRISREGGSDQGRLSHLPIQAQEA